MSLSFVRGFWLCKAVEIRGHGKYLENPRPLHYRDRKWVNPIITIITTSFRDCVDHERPLWVVIDFPNIYRYMVTKTKNRP